MWLIARFSCSSSTGSIKLLGWFFTPFSMFISPLRFVRPGRFFYDLRLPLVVIIPSAAVLEHEGKKIVYVLLSGDEFERREVTLGDESGGKVAVLAGLKAGERVVTQGALQLKMQELNPAEAGAHTHET